LALSVRDSNSGSDRGLEETRALLLEDVSYLVGPEEDNLALDVRRDVKEADVMNILPSLTSPLISDSGSSGAWLSLVPNARVMGCALATRARADGIQVMRSVHSRDDYHSELSRSFNSAFKTFGGRAQPAINVASDEFSYSRAISQLSRYNADATLMLTFPATAATIIKEMGRSGQRERWYFSPVLRDDALLWNLPEGTLEGAVGVSPSLSNNDDCDYDPQSAEMSMGGGSGEELPMGGASGEDDTPDLIFGIECKESAPARFSKYYEDRWGDAPLETAHFYYDSVILLALGLRRANANGEEDPRPQELMKYLAEDVVDAEPVAWDSLEEAFDLSGKGDLVRYLGAAGEYEFSARGVNLRALVDTWVIDENNQFAQRDSVVCSDELTIDR
jgi:neutral amino acid transport system substrate-binding protein